MSFGALIIAICQTVRAIVLTIDYYTQDLQKNNCLLKLAIKCLQYVLACNHKTVVSPLTPHPHPHPHPNPNQASRPRVVRPGRER